MACTYRIKYLHLAFIFLQITLDVFVTYIHRHPYNKCIRSIKPIQCMWSKIFKNNGSLNPDKLTIPIKIEFLSFSKILIKVICTVNWTRLNFIQYASFHLNRYEYLFCIFFLHNCSFYPV